MALLRTKMLKNQYGHIGGAALLEPSASEYCEPGFRAWMQVCQKIESMLRLPNLCFALAQPLPWFRAQLLQ